MKTSFKTPMQQLLKNQVLVKHCLYLNLKNQIRKVCATDGGTGSVLSTSHSGYTSASLKLMLEGDLATGYHSSHYMTQALQLTLYLKNLKLKNKR